MWVHNQYRKLFVVTLSTFVANTTFAKKSNTVDNTPNNRTSTSFSDAPNQTQNNKIKQPSPSKASKYIPSLEKSRKVPYPIMPLSKNKFENIYLQQILRDEAIYARPIGVTQLNFLKEKLAKVRDQLTTAEPNKRINYLRSYLDDLILISYYWSDVLYGRTESLASSNQAERELAKSHKEIITTAQEITRKASIQAEKEKMGYQLAMVYFQYPEKRAAALKITRQLLSGRALTSSQRFTLKLIDNLDKIRSNDKHKSSRAYQFFDSLSHHSNHYIATLSNLILADHLSKIPKSRMLHLKSSLENTAQLGSYRVLLKFVSSTCNKFTFQEKRELLEATVSIWKHASDFGNNWRNIPFYLTCFENQHELASIFERIALQYWASGNFENAKSNYETLHKSIQNNERKRLLNQRIVELSRLLYFQNGEATHYQDLLIRSEKIYPNSLYAIKLSEFHYEMVNQELDKAYKNKEDLSQISKAEAISSKFLTSREFSRHQRKIALKLAHVYKIRKMHRKASQTFAMLAKQSKNKHANKYLKLAIKEQALVAGWNLADPYALYGDERSSAKEQLLSMLKKYEHKTHSKSDWFLTGNIAMIEINLGRPVSAMTNILPILKQKPNTTDATKASGHLLSYLTSQQQWKQVQELAEIGLKSKIKPVYIGKTYHLNQVRENAIYMQAKSASVAKKYETAIAYFNTLTTDYSDSTSLEEYHFLKGISLSDSGNYIQALQSFKKVISLGKNSEFFKKSLLHTSRLALGMTLVDEAITNYNAFLAKYPDDDESGKVRLRLSEIYIALSKHEQALKQLAQVPDDAGISVRVQELRSQILNIFQSVGYGPEAIERSKEIIGSQSYSHQLKARAFMILTREAFESRRLDKLEELESLALNLNQSSLAVKDAISYIWYAQVHLTSNLFTKQVSRYFVEHTEESLENIKNSFQKLKTSHFTVCKQAHASFCIPALRNLSQIGDNFVSTLKSINITESNPNLNKYSSSKVALIRFLSNELHTIRAQMRANSTIGNTKPEITQQILWSNEFDWNFHDNPNAGVGYVQIMHEDTKI